MSSTKENTSSTKPVHKSKKVPCYCSRCNRKYVDIRTKCDHIALADIVGANISEEQSSSKCRHKEEPLPEFSKYDNSESESSKSEGTERKDSKDEDSDNTNSDSNRMK